MSGFSVGCLLVISCQPLPENTGFNKKPTLLYKIVAAKIKKATESIMMSVGRKMKQVK